MTMSSLRGEPEQPEGPRLKIHDPLPLVSSVDSPSSYSNEQLNALLAKKKKVDAFHSRVEQGDYMYPDEWYNGIIHATDYHNMMAGKETPTNPHIHVHRGLQPAHYMDLHTPQDSNGNNYEGSHYNFHPDTHLEWFRHTNRHGMRGYPEGEPYDWLYNRQRHDNLMGRHPALTNLDDPSVGLHDYVHTSDAPLKHPHYRKQRDSLQNVVERLHGKVYDHNHRFDRTPSYDLEQPVETGPHIPYDDNHPNNSYSRIKNMRDRLILMGSNEAMPLPHFLSYELYRTDPNLWEHSFPALAEGHAEHHEYARDSWGRRRSVGEHKTFHPDSWKWGIDSTPAMHDILEDMKTTPMGAYIRRGLFSLTGQNASEYAKLNPHFPSDWRNPAFHHPNVSAWTGAFPQLANPIGSVPANKTFSLSYPYPDTTTTTNNFDNFRPSYNHFANQDTNHLMAGRSHLYHDYLNYLIDNYGIRNQSDPESDRAIQAALLVLTKEGAGGGDGGFDGLSGTVFTSSNAGIFTPTHSERAEKRHRKNKKHQDKRRRKILGKDKKNGVERLVTFLTEGSPVKKAQPNKFMTGIGQGPSAAGNKGHNPYQKVEAAVEKEIDWDERQKGISKIESHPTMGMNNVTDGKMMDASRHGGDPSVENPGNMNRSAPKAPEWENKVYIQKAGTGGTVGIGPPTNQNTQAATGPHPQAAYTEKFDPEEKRRQVIEQNEFEDEVNAHNYPEDEKGNVEPPRAAGATSGMSNYPDSNMQLMEKAWGSGPDTYDQDALHRSGDLDDEEYQETNDKGWIPEDESKVKSWAEKFVEVKKQYEEDGVQEPYFAALLGLDNDKSI